jgi:putative nucleotidyltransferase with HDIG domain
MEVMVDSIVRNPDALTWLTRLKLRDDYTYAHSIAVSVLALALGRHLGLPREDLEVLGSSTLLQDIGKLELPKKLLDKPAALSETEYKVIQKHVAFSADILRKHKLLPRRALEIVISHHERYDGSGYPRGIKGNRIDLLSTIAGLVDCYDAMISPRPYSSPMTSFEALSRLYELANNAFPRAIIEHFIQCIGVFPIGSFVELSNGAIGIVVSRNRVRQLKPRIMLITDTAKNRLDSSETIDLAEQESVGDIAPLKISRAVEPQDFGIDPREFFA